MSQMQTQANAEGRSVLPAVSKASLRSRGRRRAANEQGPLKRLKNRDHEAVKLMMRTYHDRLLAVANRICNNPADAEEVLQDVYMTALNKIDRFEQRSSLATWLYRITVNTALMKLRSQRMVQRNTVPMEDGYAALGEKEDTAFGCEAVRSPDETYMSRELCEQVRQTVEGLPEPYKEVFLLRGIRGLSTEETGKILNVTPAAIKSRLHRSRHLIRERLNPYLE